MPERKGWYRRSKIPHIDAESGIQFVTWRLWDSVPSEVITKWKRDLSRLPAGKAERELQVRVEKYADKGHGCCLLRNSVAALAVQDTLLSHHRVNLELHGWCVMPNHVHALFANTGDLPLGVLVGRIKGASAHKINQKLGRSEPLWEEDYFDRLMRDEDHLSLTLRYVEWNPVKAKLCTDPMHWPYSSATALNRERLSGSAG